MSDLSFDYVEAQKALDIGDRTDTKALATIARVHAQATVDIAASLAMIVEMMQAPKPIYDYVTVEGGGLPDRESEPEEPEDASTAEPGDSVVRAEMLPKNESIWEVLEVGTTEGDVWLKLEGVKGKKWARDYVIVERGVGGDFE